MASSLLGSDKLKADLERISLEMEAAGEPAALAGAEALASAMRSAAPKDTGTLAASIRAIPSEGGAAVGAEATRVRQRKHRLYASIRPKEPAPEWSDPWELAAEALAHMRKARAGVGATGAGRAHLDAAGELVRQLAWPLGSST
jgi:hypothetical protein